MNRRTPRLRRQRPGNSWPKMVAGIVVTSASVAAVPNVASAATAPTGGAGAPSSLVAGAPAGAALQDVVVMARPGGLAAAEAAVQRLGGRVVRVLTVINGFSAQVPGDRLAALRLAPVVASVSADTSMRSESDSYSSSYDPSSDPHSAYNVETATGNRNLWGNGFTGSGVDVALIDSGVSPVQGLNNSGQVIYGPDLTEESQNPNTVNYDTFGHGTFMAGIIAGHDPGVDATSAAGDSTDYLGVAPDARIVSVKVADATGTTDVSQVIAGIDWVVQHAHDPGFNIRVINLSFGTDSSQSYTIDPLAYACEQAWRSGIVVVTSAGNLGGAGMTMPAADPFLISVGAVDLNGGSSSWGASIPGFSSQGNGVRNPDVLAPGNHLQGLRDPGSFIDQNYGSTGDVSDRYFRGSGTSEAAAYVSGTIAQILQERPWLTPDQVKALLVRTASPVPGVGRRTQGAGIINARRAAGPQWGRSGWTWQPYAASDGSGSIQASRGDNAPSVNGNTLSGEVDIWGDAWNGSAMAALEASGQAWSGGVWNGASLSGNTWSGNTWSGNTWSGNTWSGSLWAGNAWSGNSWSGNTWTGNGWSGNAWSGNSWSGNAWSDSAWASADWS